MSSIRTLEKYAGTKDETEAVMVVLMHAADHLYNQFEDTDGVLAGIDLLDGIRENMTTPNCPHCQRPHCGYPCPNFVPAAKEAGERTQIGNTPTCDECGEQHSQDRECGEIEAHPTYQHNWKDDRCILRGCKATR